MHIPHRITELSFYQCPFFPAATLLGTHLIRRIVDKKRGPAEPAQGTQGTEEVEITVNRLSDQTISLPFSNGLVSPEAM